MGKSKLRFKRRRMVRSDAESESESEAEDESQVMVRNNHIYFWCDVTNANCLKLITILQRIVETHHLMRYEVEPQKQPVHLHINSNGGDVVAAIACIDTIIDMKLKQRLYLITIVEGVAASAASMLSIIGNERLIRPHSSIRIHQFSTGVWGKKQDIDEECRNLTKLDANIMHIYERYTTIPKKKLKALIKREIDLSADECLLHGIVDRILE
jgi:ATP-dependent protease ClpP protease subunit